MFVRIDLVVQLGAMNAAIVASARPSAPSRCSSNQLVMGPACCNKPPLPYAWSDMRVLERFCTASATPEGTVKH